MNENENELRRVQHFQTRVREIDDAIKKQTFQ